MKTNRVFSSLLILTMLVLCVGMVSACGYHNYNGCKTDETIVEGRVYFADNNQSAGNADVTITCHHNGHDYTKTADTYNYGLLKGTYFVIFPQNKCVAEDTVTVNAEKDGKMGSNVGTVIDWITRKCLDIDLALINVPLVPEFGFVAGGLTLVSAVAIFFFVRRK